MLSLLVFAAFTTALAAPSGTIVAGAVQNKEELGPIYGEWSHSSEGSTLVARAPARCVARDDNGGALLSSSISSDGFVVCNYRNAGRCEYFTPSGAFSSGSSVCPDSITSGSRSAESARTTVESKLAARAPARCVARDDNGGALLSNSISSDGFVVCNYRNAGRCEYFTPSGAFSSGSSVCPDSITSGSRSAESARSIEEPKLIARAPARCAARDDNGGALLSSSITAQGFVACQYQNAGRCEYFNPSGQFSSGSSVCPDSITPGN
ncbi:hypothetical protein C8R43DRAFT_1107490 [Mycena crocata]|nr:hypothetical protein C8R43DRAFT_1107490 [Mycena crocata]